MWSRNSILVISLTALMFVSGCGGGEEEDIAVASIPNTIPIAIAGPAQDVLTGSSVTLSGNASSDADRDPLTYKWKFLTVPPKSNATLVNGTSPNPTFTPDVAGLYVLSLVVNDTKADSEDTESSQVTITASDKNVPPNANAGQDRSSQIGYQITLSGANTTDQNPGDTLGYLWSIQDKPDNSNAPLVNPAMKDATFTPDVAGDYVFKLVVTDDKGASGTDLVNITATAENAPPVANAGAYEPVPTGSTVQLNGSQSSDESVVSLKYAWSFGQKPAGSTANLSNSAVQKPTFTPDKDGSYELNLVVTDVKGASDTATVTIAAKNFPPEANGTVPRSGKVGKDITLDGSPSLDQNPLDSLSLSYNWEISSFTCDAIIEYYCLGGAPTPAAITEKNVKNGKTKTATFNPGWLGTYVVKLTVTDQKLSDTELFEITVTGP